LAGANGNSKPCDLVSWIKSISGMTSRNVVLSAMYSASVVQNAISVCKLWFPGDRTTTIKNHKNSSRLCCGLVILSCSCLVPITAERRIRKIFEWSLSWIYDNFHVACTLKIASNILYCFGMW
jgi:hypothetical protein